MAGKANPVYRVCEGRTVSVRSVPPGTDPSHEDYLSFRQWVGGELMTDYPDYTNIGSLLQKGAIEMVEPGSKRSRPAAVAEPDPAPVAESEPPVESLPEEEPTAPEEGD